MSIGIFYPFLYDTVQLCISGCADYFKDAWNWTDFIYQYTGILNLILQFLIDHSLTFASKITMILVLLLQLIKSFFFLRISSSFAYLVTLIRNVFYDLRIFLAFFAILIVMFSLIIGVMGW